MGILYHSPKRIKSKMPIPDEYAAEVDESHIPLFHCGLNIIVSVAPATKTLIAHPEKRITPIPVMALVDTGASLTSIDLKIAAMLGLSPMSVSKANTAIGQAEIPLFAADIEFPGSPLKPFRDVMVGACNLEMNDELLFRDMRAFLMPNNAGVLIGRDIMSRWNVVWNGPTSTVIISD